MTDFLKWAEATGRLSLEVASPAGFKVNDRVVLPMIDDVPEERGKVVFVPDPKDGPGNLDMIVVEVDEAYREEDDDGLRELSDSDVKREVKEEDHDADPKA